MKIGLTNGCFDLYHIGHEHFLNMAGLSCDYLIVAVNTDESVQKLKGRERPKHRLEDRMLQVNAHHRVKAVIPFDGDMKRLLLALEPDVVIQGQEHKEAWGALAEANWFVWIPRRAEYGSTTERIAQLHGSRS